MDHERRPAAALTRHLSARLAATCDAEVLDSPAHLAAYTTDASNYRVAPALVVAPRGADDVEAVLAVCRDEGVPLTLRGGGTSVAGNAIGPGVVLDTSRHLTAIGPLDPAARTAYVEPGVVMSDLQQAAAPHGLRFGPDPSTQNRCTIGGMIGNNACGPHAVAYGRTSDNVLGLDMLDATGRRFAAARDLAVVPGLAQLVDAHLALIRTELGHFSRQVSGYGLEHLTPERGHDLAKALVGTEGTCGIVLGATVALVPVASAATLMVLGYPDMPAAADAVPAILAHRPLAIEGLDARLVDAVRRIRRVPDLPRGEGWLLIEVGGESIAAAQAAAVAIVADAGALDSRILPPGPQASDLWRIRADGAGLAGRAPSGRQAWPGFEDAAVPPERLGAYLRDFDQLLAQHDLTAMPYGHFGDGCIHVRLDLPLERGGTALRAFMRDAAALVARHGGSMSGEHGDGRARSELLASMYSPDMLGAFAAFKHLFDPTNLLNPGIVIDPRPLDADLRRPAAHPIGTRGGFAFSADGGSFTDAVHRCTGVGKCRADTSAAGDFMCPSYQATREEKDVTRGRARVLQELANGSLVRGWDDPAVHEALELCLGCKACSRDCPAGVDMAQYKAEVTFRRYRGRLRPVSHYVLGWLPRWTRLATRAPRLVNAVTRLRPLMRLGLPFAGLDGRRSVPRFAARSFGAGATAARLRASAPDDGSRSGGVVAAPKLDTARDADSGVVSRGVAGSDTRRHIPAEAGRAFAARAAGRRERTVVLWVDSFSDTLDPAVPEAVVRVLEAAGYRVVVPREGACCGLTWITTGQLTGAKRRLVNLLDVLAPYAANGIAIVGVEPSCTAVLRSDLVELVPDDARSAMVAAAAYTLAELLSAPAPVGPAGWSPPDLTGVEVIAQPHCHQHSVMGYEADLALMRAAGATITPLASCCGMAGNFGMERGHYEVSVRVAGSALLPAIARATTDTVVVADGFSCRTQIEDLTDARPVHLAQVLEERLG